MHADRTNRAMMLLFAIVLIASGGLGAATSFGLFGTTRKHQMLSSNRVWSYYGAHGDWMWPVTALLALIIVLLAVRWMRALLLSTDRSGELPIAAATGTGRTTVAPAAINAAVTREIESLRGVTSARARLIGDPDEPQLIVTATVEDSADLITVRRRIETEALAHARQALDNPQLPIQLDLHVTTKRTSRVA